MLFLLKIGQITTVYHKRTLQSSPPTKISWLVATGVCRQKK